MIFTYYIRFYNDCTEITEEKYGFTVGETFEEVTKYLVKYYGEDETESLAIDVFSPDMVLEFDSKEKFSAMAKELRENVFW